MSKQRRIERYVEPGITRARLAGQWVRTRNRVAELSLRRRWLGRATVATFVAFAILLLE